MSLQISLFGRFRIQQGRTPLAGCQPGKAQELLSYLLLHRRRPHTRETLASLLWGDHCTTAQSKKYLRKALWQLQAALSPNLPHPLIHADAEWIQVEPGAPLCCDVTAFEAAYAEVRGLAGEQLDDPRVAALRHGVEIYTGDLLEGWYHDWCLCERERLQQIYLIMLDKLIAYYEHTHQYELGLAYGERSLHYDRARERTYQHLMRLHYALGDRTGALRQYARCRAALREELDVAPAALTVQLYARICAGQDLHEPAPDDAPLGETAPVLDRLDHIINLQHKLAALQARIQQELKAVEGFLQGKAV